jgi:hypothetical protein
LGGRHDHVVAGPEPEDPELAEIIRLALAGRHEQWRAGRGHTRRLVISVQALE